jgi:hypothetical protein
MAGHSKFLLKRGAMSGKARGKKIAAQVLTDLQGRPSAAKKHF